jgi:hypothetical protein
MRKIGDGASRAVDGEKDIGGSIKGKLQKTKECHKSQSNTLVLQSLRGRVETQPLSFWYSRSIFVSFPHTLSLSWLRRVVVVDKKKMENREAHRRCGADGGDDVTRRGAWHEEKNEAKGRTEQDMSFR